MLSPPSAPRIPVYNFTVPTEADAVAALQRVWGPERGERCWFNACGHAVEWSFCATSVRTRDAFVVESATEHPEHRVNPLVTQDGVRCYAGVPLISSRGHVLGNLCVVGLEERTFAEAEMTALRELAVEAVARIEARRVRKAEG